MESLKLSKLFKIVFSVSAVILLLSVGSYLNYVPESEVRFGLLRDIEQKFFSDPIFKTIGNSTNICKFAKTDSLHQLHEVKNLQNVNSSLECSVFYDTVVSKRFENGEGRRKVLFIGGPHFSGTSILQLLLGERDSFSIIREVKNFEAEGQHLQSVYSRARPLGGPCAYAKNPKAYMSDTDFRPFHTRIFTDWEEYWNLSKPVLVEKSPPNVLKSTWLQAVADAVKLEPHFVFTMRHPFTTLQKNCFKDPFNFMDSWFRIMETLEKEIMQLRNAYFIRYEDWMTSEDHVYKVLERMERSILSQSQADHQFSRRMLMKLSKPLTRIRGRRLMFRGNRKPGQIKIQIKPTLWTNQLVIERLDTFTAKYEAKLNRYGYSFKRIDVAPKSHLPEVLREKMIS